MRIKQKSKIIKLLLSLLFVMIPFNTQAHVLAETEKGSIEIELRDRNEATSKNDVEFALYQVATWSNSIGEWTLITDFGDTKIDINGVMNSTAQEKKQAIQDLENHDKLSSHKSGSKKTDSEGNVEFTDLELGVYLMVQISGQDTYGVVSSSLIALPYTVNNESGNNVVIKPKADSSSDTAPTPTPTADPNKPSVSPTPTPDSNKPSVSPTPTADSNNPSATSTPNAATSVDTGDNFPITMYASIMAGSMVFFIALTYLALKNRKRGN